MNLGKFSKGFIRWLLWSIVFALVVILAEIIYFKLALR